MSKDTDRTEALRAELVRSVVDGTGLSEQMALPFANSVLAYLQREYPSQQLYIPAPPRQYDVLQISAALECGKSITRVCREFCVSRSMLYKLFPGGIPRAKEVQAG